MIFCSYPAPHEVGSMLIKRRFNLLQQRLAQQDIQITAIGGENVQIASDVKMKLSLNIKNSYT